MKDRRPLIWTEETDARLLQMRADGHTIDQCAWEMQCCRTSVLRRLRALKCGTVKTGRPASKYTPEQMKLVETLWADPANTTMFIARQLRVSKGAVVSLAHRLGLPARPSPIVRKPKFSVAKAQNMPHLVRPPLPAGHPISWSLLIAGTCLEGMPYPEQVAPK